jgi:hypothetical protein
MNINPMAPGKTMEVDSKKTLFNTKQIAHEGLMRVSLKMLKKCMEEKTKKIDNIDFLKVFVITRIENFDKKANKLILDINDSTDILRIVKNTNE